MLFDIGLTNSCDMSPQAMTIKAKTSKWGRIKLMSFYMEEGKKPLNKTKRLPTEWEKTFAK